MRIEITEGASSTVGPKTIRLMRVRELPFATREGKLEKRRSAVLEIDGEALEVAEGSLLPGEGDALQVVRIRRRGGQGLVRLRPSSVGLGRFASAVERFHEQGGELTPSMAFLVEGVCIVNDVLARIDEHPDTVGTFADPLKRGQKYLQHARAGLAAAGASQPLLTYVDRYIAVCSPLIDTVMSSTQERDIEA